MQLPYLINRGLVLLIPLIIISCQKEPSNPKDENQTGNTGDTSGSAPRLLYRDTIFYLKNQPGNYNELPVSKPNAPGYFKSIPMGLSLDTITGNINITQSETGLRYKVYYVSTKGVILDSTKLVISGIDYKDAIYEITSTPNTYDTAFPIYNARPELPLPCGDDDEDGDGDTDDDDNACVFDETDLDDDGNDDIPGVIQDKLLVDKKKGTIDAEASFYAGVFGSGNPANGVSKDFTFYYRLQDTSVRALNKITVRLYHYKKRSDIPQALLDTLNERNNISIAVNSIMNNRLIASNSGSKSNQQAIVNFFTLVNKPKRPPIIIIISQ